MTALFDDRDYGNDADLAATLYGYAEGPAYDAEYWAQRWADEYRESYVGRRRARECPDPAEHDQLDRSPSQELRFPPQNKPGRCRWCDGLLPEED